MQSDPTTSRRGLLGMLGMGTLSGCTGIFERTDQNEPDDNGSAEGDEWHEDDLAFPAGPPIKLEPVVEGLESPLDLKSPSSDTERMYIVNQTGTIRIYGPDGLRAEPFLDIRDELVDDLQDIVEQKDYIWYDERGLLGVAFHPNFADNGRFYVRYSSQRLDGTPPEYDHTDVLAEYRTRDDMLADPDSKEILFATPQPHAIHNAGATHFGPDGYLYSTYGDGGLDGSTAQDIENNRLGMIVRIDVDAADGDRPYSVPDDNPLVNTEGLDECYAWGFRNPWRMSFDSNGRLFVGDVGDRVSESVYLVEKGGNYGWNIKEGTSCYNPDDPENPLDDCPDESPEGKPYRTPMLEYPRETSDNFVGNAVIGGFIYETDTIADLREKYVFGDIQGRIFAGQDPGSSAEEWSIMELPVTNSDITSLLETEDQIFSFGRGVNGELYVLTSRSPDQLFAETGMMYRVMAPA